MQEESKAACVTDGGGNTGKVKISGRHERRLCDHQFVTGSEGEGSRVSLNLRLAPLRGY